MSVLANPIIQASLALVLTLGGFGMAVLLISNYRSAREQRRLRRP